LRICRATRQLNAGSVDHHGKRRPFLIRRSNQFPIEPKNLRQMANNLSDADNREVLSIDNNLASGSSHALPTRAAKPKWRTL
jgi:hypothetical protein